MENIPRLAPWKDKVLFTPGPLTTSQSVKQAMQRDWGSRDGDFIAAVQEIRRRLVELAGGAPDEFTAIPIQGSGTFGVEAVVSSAIGPQGKLLVIVNGAYGRRVVQMAKVHRIPHEVLEYPESQHPDASDVEKRLAADSTISTIALVHCETTTGMINPIEPVSEIATRHRARIIVDAMSSFGAVPIDVKRMKIDYLVSSANKCIEGVPGFSFAIARLEALRETKDWARSLSLDLHAQWAGLESNGQFRFTPPTHALLAFHQALVELFCEGGIAARGQRYRRNHEVLSAGMKSLGFEPYLPLEQQGYIITSFRSPTHPAYDFEEFYRRLNDRGYVIYPGKVSDADCFRIGTVGRIFENDVRDLLSAIRDVLSEMRIDLKTRQVR